MIDTFCQIRIESVEGGERKDKLLHRLKILQLHSAYVKCTFALCKSLRLFVLVFFFSKRVFVFVNNKHISQQYLASSASHELT